MHRATTTDWLLIGVLLATGVLQSRAAWSAVEWQSHESIREAAQSAAREVFPGPAQVEADSPDPRLRLAQCSQPLTAHVPANGARTSRATAEVECAGAQPWRLYLPLRVTSTRPVVVAARALSRDTVLAPGDVRLAEAASGSNANGTLHETGFAVGRRLRRPVDEGQALTAGLLSAATLVRRGQQVSVDAQAGGIQVRMAGVARSDGALGDIIDVENATSGRVVQAVVRSEKSVEVLLR